MFLYDCYENEAVKQGVQLVIRTGQGLLLLGTVERVNSSLGCPEYVVSSPRQLASGQRRELQLQL